MSFQTKKIQIETLSEYLVAVRNNLKFSLKEVSEKTGIKQKFLSGLEKGEFMDLPADVYILGFLAQLAQLYAVNVGDLIKQYKKEKSIQQQLAKKSISHSAVWYKDFFSKLVITPKILSFALGAAFIALTVGYIIWQVWSINKTPALQIFSPKNNSVISGAAVLIVGATDPGTTLTINGQNVFVDNKGGFQTQLGLSQGPEEIIITAKNRFGKSFSKTIAITAYSSANNVSDSLELKINFTAAVTLGFAIDSQPMQTLDFHSGDSKLFTARQKILLSTSNAGATVVALNGKALGPMGRAKEQLNNVPFLAPSESMVK